MTVRPTLTASGHGAFGGQLRPSSSADAQRTSGRLIVDESVSTSHRTVTLQRLTLHVRAGVYSELWITGLVTFAQRAAVMIAPVAVGAVHGARRPEALRSSTMRVMSAATIAAMIHFRCRSRCAVARAHGAAVIAQLHSILAVHTADWRSNARCRCLRGGSGRVGSRR